MKKKRKKSKQTKLKEKAWSLCSKYIRMKYATSYGYNQCYTCQVQKPIKEMQAGHGIPGRTKALLFLEDIIKPQCYACNCINNGKLHIFTHRLKRELGDKRYDECYQKGFETGEQWTIPELEDLIKCYQKKIQKLNTVTAEEC